MAKRNARKASVRAIVRREMARNVETKYAIYSTGPVAVSNAGTVSSVSQFIVQGTDLTQRVGDKVKFTNVRVRINVILPTLAVTGFYRFILLSDSQNNGTAPNITDILNTADPASAYNTVNSSQKRFVIHFDKCMGMVAAGGDQAIHLEKWLRLNHITHYTAGTNTTAANGRGSLWLVAVSDQSVGVNQPIHRLDIGLHFVDS